MPITASFTYLASGLSVNFTDTSTSSSPIDYWYWEFGDGDWSEDQNPLHEYIVPGTYDVYLYVQNENYEYSEITVPITVEKIDFSFKPVNESNSFNIQFTADTPESVTSWNWDFGDGSTSSLQNPSHEYSSEGVYTVVMDTNIATATRLVEIRDVNKTRTLFIGGYDPVSAKGVIHRSVDAGNTWTKVYEYPSDAKITSIVSM